MGRVHSDPDDNVLLPLYGCRRCIKKCVFNSPVAPPASEKDKGWTTIHGKTTYKCNSSLRR